MKRIECWIEYGQNFIQFILSIKFYLKDNNDIYSSKRSQVKNIYMSFIAN